MTDFSLDNALWDFSTELYSRPGAADACVKLQNEAGVDVLLLLGALYAEIVTRRPFDQGEVDALASRLADWRENAIKPLRMARIGLKAAHEIVPDDIRIKLRNQVKAAELQAERIQLAVIFHWLDRRQPTSVGQSLELGWIVAPNVDPARFAVPYQTIRTAAFR